MLHGWGRTSPVVSRALTVDADQVAGALRSAGPRGLVARGLGRSYGDAAQNAGGTVLLPIAGETRMDGDHVVVSAGTSLHDLMRYLLPRGRFLPVTPGTRYVTVGGAIACDVHGKSHHRVGTFGANVVSADLVTPDGETHRISTTEDPELFWATVGGMGLTGVLLRATLTTIPVETGWVRVDTQRFGDLGSLTEAMRESDDAWTYSVAWVDTVSRGRALGRSVLSRGEHALLGDLDDRRARTPYPLPGEPRLSAPRGRPTAWCPGPRSGPSTGCGSTRHPAVARVSSRAWPRSSTPSTVWATGTGSTDPRASCSTSWSCPDAAEEVVHDAVRRLAAGGHASFLAVLKRFGPANDGLLSFPVAGWTLALDLPARPGLAGVLDDLDARVAEAGGRVYLAKDSRLSARTFAAMYPRADEFARVRDRVDPGRILASDLARRLGL